MEAVTALAVGQAATAATATTAATAATAGLFGSAGAFTTAGVISGVGTILSAGSALMGGFANARALEDQAEMERVRAQQEIVLGRQEEAKVLRQSNQALAHTIARAGAAGLALEGTPSDLARDINREAEMQLDTSRDTTRIAMLTRTINAQRLRRQAGQERIGGAFSGLSTLATAFA